MKFSPSLFIAAGAGIAIGAAAVFYAAGGSGADADATAGRGGPPGGAGRGGYAPVVSMTEAEAASVTRTVDVIGRVRALKSVAIIAEVTGLVKAVNIAPGKRVDQGDVLLQIDDDEQQVALARARADFPIARDNAARYRNLQSDEAASELEAEQAQSTFLSARASQDAAEVAVAQRKIIAPFDGISGLTSIEVGDYLRAGDQVTTLDDTSSIIIEFSVPQEAAGFVNIGQPLVASLTSASSVKYDGEIMAIDSRVDSTSRTLRVEATVDNPHGRLIPGAVVAVSTTTEGEAAIAAPGLAVQWDRNGAFVWRRNDQGLAERAGVVILQRTDERVLVEGDLNEGDVIVAEGADRVRGGLPLPALSAARLNQSSASSPTSVN